MSIAGNVGIYCDFEGCDDVFDFDIAHIDDELRDFLEDAESEGWETRPGGRKHYCPDHSPEGI